MKFIKKSIFSILLLTIMTSFSQCSSSKKLQDKAPATIGEAYFQRWKANVQGGSSGLNLFISVSSNSFVLDSVYFRGKSAKLETKPNDKSLYIGCFKTKFHQSKDIIMSSNPLDEFNNPLPIYKETTPFVLKDSECVVSYKDGQTTKYFKIENIFEKEATNYPTTPNNN